MSDFLNHSTNNKLFIHLNHNKMRQFFKPGFYAITFLLFLISCQKQETVEPLQAEEIMTSTSARTGGEISNVFKGPNVALGEGNVRSWVRINHLNMPLEIGVEITEKAFNHLPHERANLVLRLHNKALEVTTFKHIYFNYHPHGHPPLGVFTVPHMDAHFYMKTNEERLAIPAVTFPPAPNATSPLFFLPPPAGYMAPGYVRGAPEAQMGLHWAPSPPTFIPFSKVMIYGTYNGELTFVEPMITLQHMLDGGSSTNYPQPAKVAEAGNYPTTYNIYRDEKSGNYNITLSNFVARLAN